jgi:hypothetical protein
MASFQFLIILPLISICKLIHSAIWTHLNFQLHPTEPANYRGSHTTGSKEIADIEVIKHRNAEIIEIAGTISIGLVSIVITTMEELGKLTISEEKGCSRN